MKMDAGRVEGDKVSLTDIFRTKHRVHRNLFVLSCFADNEDGRRRRGRRQGEFNRYFSN